MWKNVTYQFRRYVKKEKKKASALRMQQHRWIPLFLFAVGTRPLFTNTAKQRCDSSDQLATASDVVARPFRGVYNKKKTKKKKKHIVIK